MRMLPKFNSILIIKSVIVVFFIGNLSAGIIKTNSYFETIGDYNGLQSIFDPFVLKLFFRQMVFLVIPMIGLLLKNKLGWIMISSYFYFLLFNILFSFEHFDMTDYRFILFIILCLGFLFFMIFLLNKRTVSFDVYKIDLIKRLAYNIIPFMIGYGMAIYLLISRNSRYFYTH